MIGLAIGLFVALMIFGFYMPCRRIGKVNRNLQIELTRSLAICEQLKREKEEI
jgi:hypothetical protein